MARAIASAPTKSLRRGDTGTVLIADIDCEAIVTRDLSDSERSARAIEDYARAYAAKEPIPAVDLFLVDGRMVLVDGDHRVKARIAMGALGVTARCVGEGELVDAMRYALSTTNKSHGLRLSPKDCRRRVMQALDAELWDGSSANAIAGKLGLSHHTVSKYMQEWEAARRVPTPATRVDTRGRVQPTAKPRRKDDDDVGTANVAPAPDRQPTLPNVPDAEFAAPPPPTTKVPMPDCGPMLDRLAARARDVRLEVKKLVTGDLEPIAQRACKLFQDAENALALAVPTMCAKCEGKGCRACSDRGWVTREQAGSKRA